MWTKKVDRNLLILRVLYEFYLNNLTVEIRRARLRELSDDKLNQETSGLHDSYGGGSFERCLRDLENQGYLTCIHSRKKETTIILNIKRIEYIIQSEQLESSFDKIDKRIIETNVEDSILEEIIEEVYGKILDMAVAEKYSQTPPESYYEIRKFIANINANMMSRAFDLNVSYDPTAKMQPNRELIIALATLIFKMVESNLAAPFKITIDFKGLSMPSKEVLSKYEPAISQSFNNCFIRWVKSAYHLIISEDDKRKLAEGKDKLLSEPVSGYYRIFCESVSHYLGLLQSTSHLV